MLPTMTILYLFLGCLIYWFSTLASDIKAHRKEMGFGGAIRHFSMEHILDFILSLLGCTAVALLGGNIPKELIDLSGPVSVLGAGYSAPSLINKLLAFQRA
jgi:hypothetical protein